MTAAGRLGRLAAPVLAFIDEMDATSAGEEALLAQASGLLDRFEAAARNAGEIPQAVPPARYGLAVLIDRKARTLPRLSIRRWSALASRRLFDGRDMSLDRIRGFRETARAQGGDYADLAAFLDHLIDRAESDRLGGRRRRRSAWPLWAAGGLTALLIALAGYALAMEFRYQERLYRQFRAEALEIGLDLPDIGADLGARLDRMAAAVARVEALSGEGPLGRTAAIRFHDAGKMARTAYEAAVARHLPGVMAAAVAEVLASEGDGLRLYDTLRARAILTGETDWSVAYLGGWLADLGRHDPLLARLSPHAAALQGPPEAFPAQDPELLAQARGFALETPEPARAYLEMERSETAAELPPWRADLAVPGLADVFLRRSGRPLSEPVPGLFTAQGWDWARDHGAGVAVQRARAEAPRLLGAAPPQVNEAPDKLLDRLHEETLAFWQASLADLRVRPFDDPVASVRISGILAASDSPLGRLLGEVWRQAGGEDRRRGHARQLRLATVFGPMIQYVESGKVSQIASLFASLNVALATMEGEDERAAERLMSIQDRAKSIAALKTAPLVVVQIVEDVLAQTSAAHADILTNPITGRWQAAVLPLCQQVVDGRFPFTETGPDADLGAFTDLFGPDGALQRFFASTLAPYLDTSASPWRWKPEARLAGLSPETAGFFEQAIGATGAFFDATGRPGAAMTLATLAERGQAVMALGGQAVSLRATGTPQSLAWPGPSPADGAAVSFHGETGDVALARGGPWGLVRLLDEVRVRRRDGGKRLLVDFRTESGRIFVEFTFEAALNPLSARGLLTGLKCPTTL